MKTPKIPIPLPKRRNLSDRGLKEDRDDISVMENPRTKEKVAGRSLYFGTTYENEWLQPMPFFWTREGNAMNGLIGLYKGATAFLICGGPSFKDLDHSKLQNCWTMCVNNSVRTYRPNAWVSVDDPTRFIRSTWLDPKIMKFQPLAMHNKDLWDNYSNQPLGWKVGDCPNVLYFRRNSKFHSPRWLWEDSFNWGNAEDFGGCRTVMLPALKILFLLGFRTVFLLGCDLDMGDGKNYHFEEKRDKGAVRCNTNTYKRMNEEYFPKLRPEFENVGFNVFNCNEKSKLTAFDYVSYDDAVLFANTMLGDIDNEPTMGMYCKKEDKLKELKEKESKPTDGKDKE